MNKITDYAGIIAQSKGIDGEILEKALDNFDTTAKLQE